jgi:uncharacterized membrane protein YphA (DoxX/SURF4 family)
MGHGNAHQVAFNTVAQAVLRMLIASYFVAVSLNLIPGTDLGILFAGVLPSPYDGATAAGLVFVLAFMVMIGYATRLAALLIALMTFYSSYLTMISLGVEEELGSFWRDLALIASLLLTYSEPAAGSRTRRHILRRMVTPRRVLVPAHAGAHIPNHRPAPGQNFASLRAGATAVRPVTPAPAPQAPHHAPRVQAGWGKEMPFEDIDSIIDNIFSEDGRHV